MEFNRPYWTRGSMAPIFESCFIFPLYSLFVRLFVVAYCSFVETNQAVFVFVVFVVFVDAVIQEYKEEFVARSRQADSE